MSSHRLQAYILLLTASVIWAVAGPVIKFVLGSVDPLTFLTYRFFLASIAGLISFTITGFHLPKSFKTIILIILYGIITSSITLGLLFFGLSETTVVEMSIISVIGPLLIAFAGTKFLHDHITPKEKLGMGITIAGMLITVIEPILFGDGVTKLSGNLLIVLYLIANTVSVILLKILLREKIKPLFLTNISFLLGFVTLLPFAAAKLGLIGLAQKVITLPLDAQLGIFFMAFLSGTFAYEISNRAQKSIEVSEAAVFSYLYPILSIPIAVAWLHEKITPVYIIGAVIILIGVVIAEVKKQNSNVKSHSSKQ